jgi:hypothetical protein
MLIQKAPLSTAQTKHESLTYYLVRCSDFFFPFTLSLVGVVMQTKYLPQSIYLNLDEYKIVSMMMLSQLCKKRSILLLLSSGETTAPKTESSVVIQFLHSSSVMLQRSLATKAIVYFLRIMFVSVMLILNLILMTGSATILSMMSHVQIVQ